MREGQREDLATARLLAMRRWPTNACSPIGSYSFGMSMLLMNAQGRVFGGTEWSLIHIACSGEAAIEAILTGAPTQTVKENVVDERHRPRNKKTVREGSVQSARSAIPKGCQSSQKRKGKASGSVTALQQSWVRVGTSIPQDKT